MLVISPVEILAQVIGSSGLGAGYYEHFSNLTHFARCIFQNVSEVHVRGCILACASLQLQVGRCAGYLHALLGPCKHAAWNCRTLDGGAVDRTHGASDVGRRASEP